MYRKKLLLLGVMGFLNCPAFAAPIPQPLTLSPAEIAKLSQYFPSAEDNTEHKVWDKKPIEIVLPVAKEKLVSFPETIELGINQSEIPADKLKIQNNNHTLYLTAKKPFQKQRVYARLVNSGKIILLDISAKTDASVTPITIETLDNAGANPLATKAAITHRSAQDKTDAEEIKPVNMLQLVRYAAQQLYAPKRLLQPDKAIFRVAMQAYPVEPLLLDGSVLAQPLASWRSAHYFVTAVLLRNQLPHAQTLDPRIFCGSWAGVSLFPRNRLTQKGNATDSTTAFLVSHQSFGQAMRVCRTQEVKSAQ